MSEEVFLFRIRVGFIVVFGSTAPPLSNKRGDVWCPGVRVQCFPFREFNSISGPLVTSWISEWMPTNYRFLVLLVIIVQTQAPSKKEMRDWQNNSIFSEGYVFCLSLVPGGYKPLNQKDNIWLVSEINQWIQIFELCKLHMVKLAVLGREKIE